jgi:hypothetical protein
MEHDLDPKGSRQHSLTTALAGHHADHLQEQSGRTPAVSRLRRALEIRRERGDGAHPVQLEQLNLQAPAQIVLHGFVSHDRLVCVTGIPA